MLLSAEMFKSMTLTSLLSPHTHTGSSINSLKFGVLPPLVAALKNRHPGAYEEGGLGQEILQYLLERGTDIMYKARYLFCYFIGQ